MPELPKSLVFVLVVVVVGEVLVAAMVIVEGMAEGVVDMAAVQGTYYFLFNIFIIYIIFNVLYDLSRQ